MRRTLLLAGLLAAALLAVPGSALAVSGAAYTTVNTAADGTGHCKNGNPAVNCNIYDGKEYVWLNGGPSANQLGPDGQYFFAVLAPGGQPDPNDGGPKNLSDDFDAYTNRTFTVSGGEVAAYAGTHDKTIPLIRLFPYADTTNPGGVYILAICSLGDGYPVAPRSCKYDAFKVQKGTAKVQSVLSGRKYLDGNRNGQLDPGEPGLAGWTIKLAGSDGTNASLTTDANGDWSYTTQAKAPGAGTTTYTVSEVQQAGWTQTGNTVNQSIASANATVGLANFVYTVTLPNDAPAMASQLYFGNYKEKPPECPPPTFGVDAGGHPYQVVTVQDADTGLASIEILLAQNLSVAYNPNPWAIGTRDPVVVTATAIDPALPTALEFRATDLAGNSAICDPLLAALVRDNGSPFGQVFGGLPEAESKVTVTNGSPGISVLELDVNGTMFRISGLRDGETRTLDIGSAMLPGRDNTVTATGRGGAGSALLFIADR